MTTMTNLNSLVEKAFKTQAELLFTIKEKIYPNADVQSAFCFDFDAFKKKVHEDVSTMYDLKDFHENVSLLIKGHILFTEILRDNQNLCLEDEACRMATVAYLKDLNELKQIYQNVSSEFRKATPACDAIHSTRRHVGALLTCIDNHEELERIVTKEAEAYLAEYRDAETPVAEESNLSDASDVTPVPGECENPYLDGTPALDELCNNIASGALNGFTHGIIRAIKNIMLQNDAEPIRANTYYYLNMFLFDLLRSNYESGDEASLTDNVLNALTSTSILIAADQLHTKLDNLTRHSKGYVQTLMSLTSGITGAGLFAYNAVSNGLAYTGSSIVVGAVTQKAMQYAGSFFVRSLNAKETDLRSIKDIETSASSAQLSHLKIA